MKSFDPERETDKQTDKDLGRGGVRVLYKTICVVYIEKNLNEAAIRMLYTTGTDK